MEKVVGSLIAELRNLQERVLNIEWITDSYHEWKKDKDEFTKFVQNKLKKIREDRIADSISDK